MSNPEIIKNSPASSTKSPSNTLLKNFQATLEKRWAEFDIATMKEAQSQVNKHPLGGLTDAKSERAKDADFIKAKSAFDQARISLNAVKDDVGLKQILNSPGNLLSAIQTLESHFALATAPEKAKEYNHVLANTLADLTSLKSQVTDTAEDKKSAEVTAIAVKAMPAVAIAAVATGGAESLLSSTDAKGLMSEGSKEIKTGIKSFIAETLGFDKKTMIEDMAKRAKGENIGFMGTIRVMIFAMLSKISFLGMTDDWSPEEMKLAGLKGKVEMAKPMEKLAEKPIEKDIYTPARLIFETLLLERTASLPYTRILDNIQMRGTSIGELQKVNATKGYAGLLSRLGLSTDEKYQSGLKEILTTLFTGNKAKYVLEAYYSKKGIPKVSVYPKDEKFSEYLITAGGVIKKMGGIAKAAVSHSMPESSIKFDTNTQDVVFTDKEEGNETLKLFGGDKKLLVYMLGTNVRDRVNMNDIDKTIGGHTMEKFYPEVADHNKAQETLKKVMNFGKSFMEGVIKNPDLHLGMNTELQSIMNERAFSLKGYALIYMTLGGRDISNFSNLSTIEQAQIYGIVMTLFQTEESNYKKGQLTSKYLTALSESTSEIPKGVTQFLKDAGIYAGEKGLSVLAEGAKYIAGLAGENPKLAGLFTALNIPWIPARDNILDLFA